MTRFNYLAPGAWPAPIGLRCTAVAIDNRIRGPLVALIASLLLTAVLSLIQIGRLHAAQAAYSRASIRLSAREPAVRAVEALRANVLRETRLLDAVDAGRRAGLAHADELTWIGNRLPARSRLRTLRYENGVYSLEGSAERAADIGAAMLALHDDGHATIPQLVSLHDDGRGAQTPAVSYNLRLSSGR